MAEGGETHLPPSGPPPSQIQTAPNLVAFDPKQVAPALPIYFQRNDVFAFQFFTNTTGISARIGYRWLTPNGEIKEGQLNTGPFTSTAIAFLPLFEGWLLSFVGTILGTPVVGQYCYVQAGLLRGSTAASPVPFNDSIWSGYLYSNAFNGYPGTPSKEITDGLGVLRSITGTAPAAGAEINETVPVNRRWNLIALFASLTSSATVINRTPAFFFDDGANIFSGSEGIFTQPASTTSRYSFSTVVPSQAFISNFLPVGLLLPFPLKGNFRIRSTTLNLQAGDQWTAPQYLVQEWGAWDN